MPRWTLRPAHANREQEQGPEGNGDKCSCSTRSRDTHADPAFPTRSVLSTQQIVWGCSPECVPFRRSKIPRVPRKLRPLMLRKQTLGCTGAPPRGCFYAPGSADVYPAGRAPSSPRKDLASMSAATAGRQTFEVCPGAHRSCPKRRRRRVSTSRSIIFKDVRATERARHVSSHSHLAPQWLDSEPRNETPPQDGYVPFCSRLCSLPQR